MSQAREDQNYPISGRGDNRAVTEFGFAHVTTKTWAYLGVFGFIRKIFVKKKMPPHHRHRPPSLSPPPPPWWSSPPSPSSPPLLSEPGWLQTLAEQGPLVHRPQPSTLASVPSVRSQEESTLKLSQGGRRGNCAFTRHRKTFLLRNIVNQI